MNVNLSPAFESYIQQQLESGMYNNASEVVRDALRLKMQQDQVYNAKFEALRNMLLEGENSGDPTPLDMHEIIAQAQKDAGVDA